MVFYLVSLNCLTANMMTSRTPLLAVVLVCLVFSDADAQFRERGLTGRAFRPRGIGSATSLDNASIGVLDAGARFRRENRRRGMFVGADAFEQQTFVGSVQGVTQPTAAPPVTAITTATQGPSAVSINTQRQPSTGNGIYDPPLVVAFDVPRKPVSEKSAALSDGLAQITALQGCQISLSVIGRNAILRGYVEAESQKWLAEQLLLMEPGISQVRNQLLVSRAPQPEMLPPQPETLPPQPEALPRRPSD